MSFDLETLRYLPLLVLLPAFWWAGSALPRRLGWTRAVAAIVLRSVVFTSVVFALSGLQWGWFTDRVSVVYLLDQSDSISAESKRAMWKYAVDSSDRDRVARRADRVGLICFAGDAQLEIPPFDADLPARLRAASTDIRADATDVEQAIDLAIAAMPPETRHRVVLISDGNETSGNAARAASHAARRGVGIDIVPIKTTPMRDVSLERLDIPSRVDAGQPFAGRLVVSAHHVDAEAPVRGRVTVTQSSRGEERLVLSETVTLRAGKTVLPFEHRIETPAGYSFEASFVPESADADARRKNNRVSAFTKVGGVSRTLLIVPMNGKDGFDALAEILRRESMEVDVRTIDSAFSSPADLLAYDSVILANIPRAGGDSADTIVGLSDSQTEMLVQNTQRFGAGLLMIGGPDALGAGGWGGTKLEAAMPVDFDIKNSEIRAVGALMIVLDTSGSMGGPKLALSKSAARQAILSLGESDFAGVLSFDGQTREIIPLQRVGDPRRMLPALSRVGAGGGTVLYPAMSLGYAKLARVDAMVKHMIIVTDGQTQPGRFGDLTDSMRADGITVSTLAVGDDADVPLLRRIASGGGGKFYRVRSPLAIPKIVLRESRRVSKPLIFETDEGITPEQLFPHVVMDSVQSCPPITGLVLTTPKDSSLVQNVLMSPRPGNLDHPILSVWTYGLGRSAVLTTDAGQRWTESWADWPDRNKLLSQLVRWLKRPDGGSDRFQIASRWSDGEVRVVVDAIAEQDIAVEPLVMQGQLVGPNSDAVRLDLKKVAPGRFVGTVPVAMPGSYFVQVAPNADVAPIIAGVTVPFGLEYRSEATNLELLGRIANNDPPGGEKGMLTATLDVVAAGDDSVNHFRDGLRRRARLHTAWPVLILISCVVFLGDVGNRRLATHLGWIGRRWFAVPRDATNESPRPDHIGKPNPSISLLRDMENEPVASQEEPPRAYVERLLAAKRRVRDRNDQRD